MDADAKVVEAYVRASRTVKFSTPARSRSMKNLEAKFPLANHAEAEARATAIGYTRRAILHQRDTFFRVANGNLKLREKNGKAVLIYYHSSENCPPMLTGH